MTIVKSNYFKGHVSLHHHVVLLRREVMKFSQDKALRSKSSGKLSDPLEKQPVKGGGQRFI